MTSLQAPYALPSRRCPAFLKPCGAPFCPQSQGCLRSQLGEPFAFNASRKGCPFFVDDLPRFLSPSNFHGQFIEPSDEAASARIQAAVQDVIDGTLSPDTDFMQLWVSRFSGSNLKGDKPLGDHLALLEDGTVVAVGSGKAMAETLAIAAAAGVEIKAETQQ